MRIAWVGPTPAVHGGASYVGTQLLQELARAGVEVDCFVAGESELPPGLADEPGLTFFCHQSGWEWGRWYSRGPLRAFFSGNLVRARAQFKLADKIAARHREQPYDLVYQFSQSEMFPLRLRLRELPPIVVHPSTHAAGELFWHKREDALSRRCEPFAKRLAVRAMLHARARVQRRDMLLVHRVLPVSRRFGEHIARDYRLSSQKWGVVPNPIDLERFTPSDADRENGPVRILFVSRMSARKGVDMVVELSHRLDDLRGRVWVSAIGGATTWSDYRPLLADLNPRIASFDGQRTPYELAQLYQSADAVLQPSLYEPFALTVGEALASGLPVIASDEVGAVEGVDPDVCAVFRAGDLDALEREVRRLIDRIERGEGSALRPVARAEAERLFAPATIAATLVSELEVAAARRRNGRPVSA
jgi:glycosyltransferase involved in cell wall biosynthesis